MKSHFFAYVSRMRFIQRWALMRNTAPENVQEHSHQVAVLAHALAVIRKEKFGGAVDPGAVAAEMRRDYLTACVGRTYPVLFEQPKDGKFFGHAPNYMEVLAEGDGLHNVVKNVRVTSTDGDVLFGEILED